MVSGNKSKEMLQIFELGHLQMANSFNSAHNGLLFFSFEEQCKSAGLAMSLFRKGCSSVPTPAHSPVSEATGCESHETTIFHGAKVNIMYLFLSPGIYTSSMSSCLNLL